MALISTSVASAKYRFMLKTPQEYIFTFLKLHKSWRKGTSPARLVFHKYVADKELCVVKAIDAYLSRTKT